MASDPRAEYIAARNAYMEALAEHENIRFDYASLGDVPFLERKSIVSDYEESLSRALRARVASDKAQKSLLESGMATGAERAKFDSDARADAQERAIERIERAHFRQIRDASIRLRSIVEREEQEEQLEQETRAGNQNASDMLKAIEVLLTVAEAHKDDALRDYEAVLDELSDVEDLPLPANTQSKIASFITGLPGSVAKQTAALRKHMTAVSAAPTAPTNLLGNPLKQTGGKRRKMPYTMRRSRRGCQVVRGRKTFSRRPIACSRAERQMRLLRAVERGWRRKTVRRTRR